jgi:hypothetical protein
MALLVDRILTSAVVGFDLITTFGEACERIRYFKAFWKSHRKVEVGVFVGLREIGTHGLVHFETGVPIR